MYRIYITKFRLSAHTLAIEYGRYKNVTVNERICNYCKSDIEDELHFILICPLYTNIRHKYIKPYYWKSPSVYKLIQLFALQNVKQLCNLGKYLSCACKIRNLHFK